MAMEEKKTRRQGITEVGSLAQRKVVVLRRYLSLTEDVRKCVENKQVQPLVSLLARRQKCVEEVEKIDRQLKKAAARGTDSASDVSCVGEIRNILLRIQALDQDVIGRLKPEADALKQDLVNRRTARRATTQYRRSKEPEPRFLDVSR